ncbi:MAG: AFG1/ZapE family ATPase [Acidobacteriota bacterium]|jgi:DNA replication protein DnaC
MQSMARILTANLAELQPGERAAATPCIAPGNEPEHECPRCMDSGWRRIDLSGNAGMRQCECVEEKARARCLALIPERFRDSSFESFKPRDPRQERALSLMQGNPGGSWYLTGAYGNGKTHLLYAQYRELVTAGQARCHVRTTRELVEELRRAEFDEDFVSPVIAAASRHRRYHLFWDDIDKLKLTDFKTEVLFDLVDSLYRHKHGLTVTGNYSMRDLVENERMHPAIVRRLDDMCRVLDV